MTRTDQRNAFLRAQGLDHEKVIMLKRDASFRSHWRIADGSTSAVLMDAPPPFENAVPFLNAQSILEQANLSVPRILSSSPDEGFILMEDFGDDLYGNVLNDSTQEMLYDTATDALTVLGSVQTSISLPMWTTNEMVQACKETFIDWWWPVMFHTPASPQIEIEFRQSMSATLAPVEALPLSLVHRDFFADNLLWLDKRAGLRRVGIIDFQDLALGSPAYDLVSLLQDSRRDITPALVEREIRRYLEARKEIDPEVFSSAFAACAANRHLRVAALWVRLACRDSKSQYLKYGPRCWTMLRQALNHPTAAPLSAFLDHYVPDVMRRNPPTLEV